MVACCFCVKYGHEVTLTVRKQGVATVELSFTVDGYQPRSYPFKFFIQGTLSLGGMEGIRMTR